MKIILFLIIIIKQYLQKVKYIFCGINRGILGVQSGYSWRGIRVFLAYNRGILGVESGFFWRTIGVFLANNLLIYPINAYCFFCA